MWFPNLLIQSQEFYFTQMAQLFQQLDDEEERSEENEEKEDPFDSCSDQEDC